jgi:polyisoprenyl-phosphate glycosyltransferase
MSANLMLPEHPRLNNFSMKLTDDPSIIILIPVYNDWTAGTKLLEALDQVLVQEKISHVRVLLVDDGSSLPLPDTLRDIPLFALEKVEILALRRNLGHQRAIAVGLCYIDEHISGRAVLVMDGDGEDKPSDVPILLRRFDENGGRKVIFAERARRTESLLFKVFYKFYKGAHLLLTGQRVRVANFSILPTTLLTSLVVVSDLWNHYAAAVFKARLPIDMVPLARGHRYDGKSHMNFVSLVTHGLSAMSVHGDKIGVRLLMAASGATVLLILTLIYALTLRFGFNIAIPSTATYFLAALFILLPQFLMMSLVFIFLVLAGRDSSSFIPLRDYSWFVYRVYPVGESRK